MTVLDVRLTLILRQKGNGMDLRGTGAVQMVGSPSGARQTVGIWRLISLMHQGPWTELFLVQPADAAGSPRCDYVLKMARRPLEQQPEGALQIRAEVAAASAVRHPNVMTVLDRSLSAAHPYFVMPRIEGPTLDAILRRGIAQALPVILWWGRQVAQGLAALHAEGWVHRDLKPENVLVSPQGHVTILDFGFATQANNLADPVFRGTPEFAAPELLRGNAPINPSADIYALGCMLKAMLGFDDRHRTLPEAVARLVEDASSEESRQRPSAAALVDRLLRLEIETLGRHIRPESLAA